MITDYDNDIFTMIESYSKKAVNIVNNYQFRKELIEKLNKNKNVLIYSNYDSNFNENLDFNPIQEWNNFLSKLNN